MAVSRRTRRVLRDVLGGKSQVTAPMTPAERLGTALVAALVVLVAFPLPITLRLFAAEEAGRAWPFLWLLMAGTTSFACLVGRVSVPLALLFTRAALRTLAAGVPVRSLYFVIEGVACLSLYLLAHRLPNRADSILRWCLIGAGTATALIGL